MNNFKKLIETLEQLEGVDFVAIKNKTDKEKVTKGLTKIVEIEDNLKSVQTILTRNFANLGSNFKDTNKHIDKMYKSVEDALKHLKGVYSNAKQDSRR